MIKKLLFPILLMFALSATAQFNNSWIDYSKTYYKFKLAKDNVYRIPQSTLAAANLQAANADHFQLWRNGQQVRLYTSVSGTVLGASDYIEFWGEANDGKPDLALYRKPEFQLADKYSLETDTAAYFLTVNTAGNNLRFTNTANTAPSTATPDAYFMRNVDVYYNSTLNKGYGKDYDEYVYSSSYDDGEGFTTGEIVSTSSNPGGIVPGTFTENLTGLNVYSAGPATGLSARAYLFSNTDNCTRTITFKVFNNVVDIPVQTSDPSSTVFNKSNLPLTWLQNTATAPLTVTTQNDTYAPPAPSPAPPNDRTVIARLGITYPATFNFNNLKAFDFELAASASGNYLVIDNFNYGAAAPALYDFTTGKRYVGDITSTPGKVKFVLPASADPVRKFKLINEEVSNSTAIAALTSRTFANYNTTTTRGDYIIVSNPRLYNDGTGNNYVEQYRQYRSSANGGGYNAKVYDINELTDQFAFGIKSHPEAIRNFVRFMDAQYPVKPKFVFIIGRGLTFLDQRIYESNPVTEQLDLVQSFGWPASDVLLVSTPGIIAPITPVGRLAAINGTEVGNYLQKVQEYELAQRTPSPLIADKAWMKHGIHIVGGKTESESGLFRFYMDNYKDIYEDSLYGGKAETFVKTTVATVQQASSERITQLFQEGLGMIGYFGHSSANLFEFNLSDPSTYNNIGKYPFFNVSGCSAGNFYSFDASRLNNSLSISEKYILTKQKGSIGFLADTHYGVPPALNIFNTTFYSDFCRTLYGQTVGDQLKSLDASIGGADPNLDYLPRIHLEEINLHGDPAIRINNFAKPDYAIEDRFVKITPDVISVIDASFKVKVTMANIGKATNDSIRVYVKRLLPGTTTPVTLYDEMILAPKNTDSLEITVPINPVTDKGQNQLIVELDYTFRVPELYETNNKITKDFFIFEDELRPIYPYNYSIVNTQGFDFYASTANPLIGTKNYVMEIDTTQLFNSPFKKTFNTSGPGGLIKFTPTGLTLKDSTVYYWRTSITPATGSTVIWNGMSFIYLPASTPGFNQSHYFQYTRNTYDKMLLDVDRILKFTPKTSTYSVRTTIYPPATNDDFSLDNAGFIEQSGFYAPYPAAESNILRFYVVDAVTLKPIKCLDEGTQGSYGSWRPIPINTLSKAGFFHFDISTKASRDNVVAFLNAMTPGNFIVLTNCPTGQFSHLPAEWNTDGPNNLYLTLKGMGLTDIDQIATNIPFIFVTQKGSNVATVQLFGTASGDRLSASFDVTGKQLAGTMTSDVFGPAKKWNSLHWRGTSLETPTADLAKIEVIGLNVSGSEDLLAVVSPAQDTALDWIDAQVYPNLKLRMQNEDSVKATPLQLRYWRINADLVPEGAVAPNIAYTMKDTVEAGEPINFTLAFKNISPVKFDSLIKVRFQIRDNNNLVNDIAIPARKALVSNDTLMVSYQIDSRNFTGNNTLFIEFNPDNHQPEQYHFNNVLYKAFYVKSDKFNPLLDVTFDGVHILNKDIVASKPNILVKLKDENRFLELKDTALMKVQVRYPDNSLHNYYFNNDTLRFIPANLSAGENTASIEMKPYFPEDGDYELIISGRDVTGNTAGSLDYNIGFTVINKPMISELLNYPNPFTTSTAFVFTLTGSTIPQNMRIQILTITGKVVREITKDELGPIHVGRNITEFKWDGTDMYGQKLANGVYIYRVLTNLNGKSLDKYKADGDNTSKYFNKGYGKMYLMR